MLWHLGRIAIPGASPGGLDQNAFKESFLIHARCLMDFFNGDPRGDDLVASHFAPNWNPARDGGEELKWLTDNLDQFINKRVAHLTAYRQRVPKESEPYFIETVQRDIQTVVERFLAQLPDDLRMAIRGLSPR